MAAKPFITSEGEEITPEKLEELAAEAERGYERVDGKVVPVGRPGLSASGPSRQVRIRVEPELGESLDLLAKAEERTLSEVARDALREYVEKHAA